MGRVFQSYNLFGHMTVIENIMHAPVKLLGKSRQDAYDKGIELLKRVGLEDRALKYPCKFKPEDSEEKLSYKILMANAESVSYSYDETEGSTIVVELR